MLLRVSSRHHSSEAPRLICPMRSSHRLIESTSLLVKGLCTRLRGRQVRRVQRAQQGRRIQPWTAALPTSSLHYLVRDLIEV